MADTETDYDLAVRVRLYGPGTADDVAAVLRAYTSPFALSGDREAEIIDVTVLAGAAPPAPDPFNPPPTRPGGLGRHLLDTHMARLRMHNPTDAAQQYALTMARQSVDLLEAVLHDEHIHPGLIERVLRGWIYGAMPSTSEAELRETMRAQQLADIEHRAPVSFAGTGLGGAGARSDITRVGPGT